MSTTMAQRRQLVLDALDRHERMAILLSCLEHSPNLWEEPDNEVYELTLQLIDQGFIDHDGNVFRTNAEGRRALIAYINEGVDE